MSRPLSADCSSGAGCPPEVREFVRWLGGTRAQQLAEVRHLLLFANSDGMSTEDRTICRQALEWLTRDRARHGR